MAQPKDKRLVRLFALRLKHLRIARRAKKRYQRTKDKEALKVYRRHRELAQEYLQQRRARRKALRYRLKRKPKTGLAYWGGKQVAAWIVPFLDYGRAQGWQGGITSGYRSYAKQWWIYYVARIRPAALPGRSNHEGYEYPRGAVDVSDPWGLNARIHGHAINGRYLRWYGAGDVWHFSSSGR